MRSALIALMFGSVVIFVGCGGILSGSDVPHGAAKLVFINRTDSVFCYDDGRYYDSASGTVPSLSPSDTRAGESCDSKVKPDGRTVWLPDCYSDPPPDYTKGIPLDVVLSAETSPPVYSGFARCDEETTFLITWLDGRFMVEKTVTKPLQDP